MRKLRACVRIDRPTSLTSIPSMVDSLPLDLFLLHGKHNMQGMSCMMRSTCSGLCMPNSDESVHVCRLRVLLCVCVAGTCLTHRAAVHCIEPCVGRIVYAQCSAMHVSTSHATV